MRAGALLTEALSSWRGQPFADLEEWSTIGPLVARLTETRRVAEEALVSVMLASDRTTEAVTLLETLVVEQPLRERRWVLYLLALDGTGRRADALRAFQHARDLLGDIGLEPAFELCDVEQAIASADDRLTAQLLGRMIRSIVGCIVRGDGHEAINAAPRSAAGGNMPQLLTRWFGNREQMERFAAEVTTRRLTTLTGPGGVGKTRTALEVCRLVAYDFADGAWFLDLAAISDVGAVVPAIASTLAVAPQPGMSILEALLDWLRGQRALLVFDNCEHVTNVVADVISAINTVHDSISVLTTSRETLGLSWECVVPIGTLGMPDAVAMFCDRAQSADPTVTFTDHDVNVVAAICERLDGMPLAIELAAARIRTGTPEDLLDRLDHALRVLRRPGRGGLGRHRSLRTSIEWSHRLLNNVERTVFERLSAFAGAFDASDAIAVAAGDDIVDVEVIDALDGLVDQSMVMADRRSRTARYRLLDALRQFGVEQLAHRCELSTTRGRHLAHYVARAEHSHRLWVSPRQVEADTAFEQDWNDLRAAHQWAIATSDVDSAQRLVAGVDAHAQTRMRTEVGTWARLTLALATPIRPVSADLYGRVAHWTMYTADYQAVIDLAAQGIAAAPTPDDPDTTLRRAFQLVAMLASGRLDHALDAACALHRTASGAIDPFVRAWGWGALCLAAPAVSRADYDTWVTALEHDAARFDTPFLRLSAIYYRAMKDIFVDDPPDTKGPSVGRSEVSRKPYEFEIANSSANTCS